jgi:hypothetical protein
MFIVLLNYSKFQKTWFAEFECTRLQTICDNNNGRKSSKGFCDVFYTDDKNSYIIEIKYDDTIDNDKIESLITKATDQAKSYQIAHINPTICYSAVFFSKKDNLIGFTFQNGDKPYTRFTKFRSSINFNMEARRTRTNTV